MKAKPIQIEALQKQICSGFKGVLIHGADFGIVEDCAQKIIKMIQPVFDEFSFIKISKTHLKENPSCLLDEGNMVSFLGGRKLIWFKDADSSFSETVENYITYIKSDTFLIITADALPKSSPLRYFAENSSDMLEIACYSDDNKDMSLMINAYLREKGYSVSPNVLSVLTERLIENRSVAKSELEKLILYIYPNKEITINDIMAVVSETQASSFDDFCCSVALGSIKKADRLCKLLLSNGETPVSILRILTGHFNKLLLACDMSSSGVSSDEILKKLLRSNQFKLKDLMLQQISIWNKDYLVKTLSLLLETEKQTKTSEFPAELILERTVTVIANLAKKINKY